MRLRQAYPPGRVRWLLLRDAVRTGPYQGRHVPLSLIRDELLAPGLARSGPRRDEPAPSAVPGPSVRRKVAQVRAHVTVPNAPTRAAARPAPARRSAERPTPTPRDAERRGALIALYLGVLRTLADLLAEDA